LLYWDSPRVLDTTDGAIGTRCSVKWDWSTTAYPHLETSEARITWELLAANSDVEPRKSEVDATFVLEKGADGTPVLFAKKFGCGGPTADGIAT
jgi:hypothetical protein